jgi:hypothetical protein
MQIKLLSVYEIRYFVMPDLIRHPVTASAELKRLDSGFRRNDVSH